MARPLFRGTAVIATVAVALVLGASSALAQYPPEILGGNLDGIDPAPHVVEPAVRGKVLAVTGGDIAVIALIGAALVVAGLVLLRVRSRTRVQLEDGAAE